MDIKVLKTMQVKGEHKTAGEIAENVSDFDANYLINRGFAEEAKAQKKPAQKAKSKK